MDTYQNKIVLVTGASTGIGRAMAIDLAAKGAELILTARSKEQLDALAQEIQGKGGMAHVFVEDLAQPTTGQLNFADNYSLRQMNSGPQTARRQR